MHRLMGYGAFYEVDEKGFQVCIAVAIFAKTLASLRLLELTARDATFSARKAGMEL